MEFSSDFAHVFVYLIIIIVIILLIGVIIYCLLCYTTLLIAGCNVKLIAYSYLLILVLTCFLMFNVLYLFPAQEWLRIGLKKRIRYSSFYYTE